MTRHDEVFAMFVEANPVSSAESDAAPVPTLEATLSHLVPQAAWEPLVPSPSTVRRRWVAAAAAFVLVVAAVGVSIALLGRRASAPPVTPSTTTTIDALAVVASDAEDSAARLLAAIAAGDIDAVMALSTPDASEVSDRRVHEFNAAFASAGMPMMTGDCTAEQVTATSALVRCQTRPGDPVALELGVSEVVTPFRYQDGLLAWQEMEGIAEIGAVNRAYADYLRAYRPREYDALCSPAAYAPGSIVQSNLLALTGECGELAASAAGDVLAWIRAGRPLE